MRSIHPCGQVQEGRAQVLSPPVLRSIIGEWVGLCKPLSSTPWRMLPRRCLQRQVRAHLSTVWYMRPKCSSSHAALRWKDVLTQPCANTSPGRGQPQSRHVTPHAHAARPATGVRSSGAQGQLPHVWAWGGIAAHTAVRLGCGCVSGARCPSCGSSSCMRGALPLIYMSTIPSVGNLKV